MLLLNKVERNGELVDFKGNVHYITVVGIVQKDELCDQYIASLGISICNPSDTEDYNKGHKLAEKRALSFYNTKYVVVSKLPNVFTLEWLVSWVKGQLEYVKNNPGVFIKGYNYASKRYKKQLVIKSLINELSDEERVIYDYICCPKVDKYKTLNELLELQK